jgi:hypothetical protein
MADNGGARTARRLTTGAWGAAALVWLAPLVAMQFSAEMAWDGFDFALLGVMLLAACGALELATRMTGSLAYLAGAAVAIGAAFLLVFLNLAVGVIGSEDNPANLMFAGVLAVALVGAAMGRFRPRAMATAMLATAGAQALVAAVALRAQWGEGALLTAAFVAPWLASAWLFRRAASRETAG